MPPQMCLQGRISGFLHSIKSDVEFETSIVPPSPERGPPLLPLPAALPVIGIVPGNADTSLLVRPTNCMHEQPLCRFVGTAQSLWETESAQFSWGMLSL